ncbi:S1C family serine protease [Deinococcus cellulosilyticus]|uniref:Serine protease n=1 Tax=Deinococcus cellulosilyticus (strain DSM 18568 / NBRC 106333 / KACC 11606 / 5516J-15) TaxID=1223518 RepID=A0A511MV87_DEIC1|nr:S1C family serine protease [Deinococcus cellulosilyticus]GEM44494.1 serine protease [Deinococcus cellulosilyticus NBRC 106333 = KACC 11606]
MRRLPLLLIPVTAALAAVPYFSHQSPVIPQVQAQQEQPWRPASVPDKGPSESPFRSELSDQTPYNSWQERRSLIASSTLEEVYEKSIPGAVRVIIGNAGLGTGFFITSDGYIMTAAHVALGDTSEPLSVLTSQGKEYPATLVGYDELKDLAIIKVKGNNFPTLQFSSSTPKVGDGVVAIGNSRGSFDGGRAGKVTRLGASLSASFPSNMVASSMPLAPGDSGGPVLNDRGEVVGVSTAISSGAGHFSSYFVPLTTSSQIVKDLQAGLKKSVPIIGVSIADARDYLDAEGVLVTEVVPGLGAHKAGIKDPQIREYRDDSGRVRQEISGADVIVAVEGKNVNDSDDLIGVLRSKKAGDQVTLKVRRGEQTLTLKVTLTAKHKV